MLETMLLALLGGLQQEGRVLRVEAAQLEEGAHRRLEVVDEAVPDRNDICSFSQLPGAIELREGLVDVRGCGQNLEPRLGVDHHCDSLAQQPVVVCAPYALHGALIADFAPGHSLVQALQKGRYQLLSAGESRLHHPSPADARALLDLAHVVARVLVGGVLAAVILLIATNAGLIVPVTGLTTALSLATEPTPIAAWDWRYLAEKVRQQEFDIDGKREKKDK